MSSDHEYYLAHSSLKYMRNNQSFNRKRYDEDENSSSRSSKDSHWQRVPNDRGSTGESGSTRRSDTEYKTRRSRRSGSEHRRRSRTASNSPTYQRNRDNRQRGRPARASRCIGVFGLNTNTSQLKIRELFSKFGPIERIQMVIDAHTNRSRGFCFIYFENMSDARAAKDACSGIDIDDRRIRVDYSITQRAHTPTPGVYMGRSTRSNDHGRSHDRYGYSKNENYSSSRRYDRDSSHSPKRGEYRRRDREYSANRYSQKSSSRHHYDRSRSRSGRSRSHSTQRKSNRY